MSDHRKRLQAAIDSAQAKLDRARANLLEFDLRMLEDEKETRRRKELESNGLTPLDGVLIDYCSVKTYNIVLKHFKSVEELVDAMSANPSSVRCIKGIGKIAFGEISLAVERLNVEQSLPPYRAALRRMTGQRLPVNTQET